MSESHHPEIQAAAGVHEVLRRACVHNRTVELNKTSFYFTSNVQIDRRVSLQGNVCLPLKFKLRRSINFVIHALSFCTPLPTFVSQFFYGFALFNLHVLYQKSFFPLYLKYFLNA